MSGDMPVARNCSSAHTALKFPRSWRRSMRIEGTVKLLAVLAPNGKPTSTKVMVAHPTPALEETREVVEMHFRPE
jgi:outer membrane biosynthesis protein TonB